MAISTNTESLISIYQQTIRTNTDQIAQVEATEVGFSAQLPDGTEYRLYGIEETLDYFGGPIRKLDARIVEINSQIVGLQNTILDVGQTANSCGCGGVGVQVWDALATYTLGDYVSTTAGNLYLVNADGPAGSEPVHTTGTVGIYDYQDSGWTGGYLGISSTTVVNDTVPYRGYSYTSPNPFSAISGTLTSVNAGIGTETLTGTVNIGQYIEPIGTARTDIDVNPICPGVTNCTGYATSITNLSNQVTELQSERNALITKVNYLKKERIRYSIREYGFNRQKEELNAEIGISSSIISFLQDPANEEWL